MSSGKVSVSNFYLPEAHVRARVAIPLWLSGDSHLTRSEVVTFNGLIDSREHLAIVFGDVPAHAMPLVRAHSECLTGDVFGSARCDCGPQLRTCLATMRYEGGILLYLRQEGRGIGLYNKLDAYRLQDGGMDTFEANRALKFSDDQRTYLAAAQMLFALGVHEIELMSNNPDKIRQLRACGVSIPRHRPTGIYVTDVNRRYLEAKRTQAGHLIDFSSYDDLGRNPPMIEHLSPISGIAAFKNKYVATAGYDNQVILWDQKTKRPLTRVLHDHLANQCAFSPDGSMLVSSSSDYTARLWSVPDMRLRAVFNDQEDDVEMSVFHPTRELVATASRDHKLRVYDFQGTLIKRFEGHAADVISVEWAGDSDELITSSDDGTVKRWSLATGALLADIDLGGVETDTIVIGRDGTLYAGNDDGEIVMIRGASTTAIPAHAAGIKRLVLNSERNLLVSLSYDRTMLLWKSTPDGLVQVDKADIPDDVWPRSGAFAADSEIVFGTFGTNYRTYDYGRREWLDTSVRPTFGGNAVCAYQGSVYTVGDAGIVIRDGEELTSLGSLCNFLTPVGSLIATGGQLGRLFDALTGRVLHQHRSPLNCGAAFIRDDAQHIVVGAYTGEGLVFRVRPDGSLTYIQTIPLHHNAVKGVAVSGEYIFSVCADTSVAWHSVRTLEPVHEIHNAHDRIANGCVGLGEGYFASVGRDLQLRVWAPDFTARVVSTTHPNSIKCVAAADHGRLIATGSYHGHVKVYDRELEEWVSDERPTTSGISSLAEDADRGLFLASSYDGRVYEVFGKAR